MILIRKELQVIRNKMELKNQICVDEKEFAKAVQKAIRGNA